MGQNDLVANLNIELLIPNPYQPRKNFNEQSLKELSQSIKEYGIINPILVRQKNERYEIIAGERRVKAAKMLGMTEVPAIIKNIEDKKMAEIALIDNLQHENITPIEEARSYQEIINLSSITEQQLSEMLGKSQAFISNKIRLLNLPNEIQDALINRKISERHARSLLTVKDKNRQIELLNMVIEKKLTVKDLDEILKEENLKEEKKEEKESDIMNNDNFFPGMNPQPNNNASLNTMNMQTMNQDTTQAPAPSFNQPPILDPNVIQFPAPDTTNTFNQPSVVPTPETATPTPATPAIEGNVTPQLGDNNANNFGFGPSPAPTDQGMTLPTAPVFGQPETPAPTPATPVETPAPVEAPTLESAVTDIPLFATQNVEQPQAPAATPVAPAAQIAAPESAPAAPVTDAPLFNMANQGLEIPGTTPAPTEVPAFNVPVAAPAVEEDKFTKIKNLLTENNIEYKAYSNETNHCIIIEI